MAAPHTHGSAMDAIDISYPSNGLPQDMNFAMVGAQSSFLFRLKPTLDEC
jgi:hypothetical protein